MIHCHLLFQLSYPLGVSLRQEHVNRRAARAGRDLDEPGPEAEGETGRACDRSDARMQALLRRAAKIATECPAGADRANENERRLANPAHEIAWAAKLDPRSQEQHVVRASKHPKKFLLRRGRANCVRLQAKNSPNCQRKRTSHGGIAKTILKFACNAIKHDVT